jgi:sortase A
LNLRHLRLGGAFAAPLLLVMLALAACTGPLETVSAEHGRTASSVKDHTVQRDNLAETTANGPVSTASGVHPGSGDKQPGSGDKTEADSGTVVKTVLPEDVLSEKDLKATPPKYEDWYEEASSTDEAQTLGITTAGAVPAVKPFNFGRDPGGPDDKTLYLTVPKLGLEDVTAYNSVKDEKLKKSTVHIPATGFPWQKGANTYIAGHRVGYEGTNSHLVFYYLEQLVEDDKILLEDTAGTTYTYRVTDQLIVDPDNVEVMEPEEGKSLVSLQTCTLPDYKQRLIVQGELVDKSG